MLTCFVGMEDLSGYIAVLDDRIVSDLAKVLDDATREELLQSFEQDVLRLLSQMDGAAAGQMSEIRHALLGVTGLIGARQLHDHVEGRAATAAELRHCLEQTMVALRDALALTPAQESQQRAG